jgi:uncharacterized membrane protein YtjA (UPF0391 family)
MIRPEGVPRAQNNFDGPVTAGAGILKMKQEVLMLRWSMTFLVIAIVAGLLGLGGVAGTAADIAKVLFIAFLCLFGLSLAVGLWTGHKLTHGGHGHLTHHHR